MKEGTQGQEKHVASEDSHNEASKAGKTYQHPQCSKELKKRTGTDGMSAIGSQNEAFKPFRSAETRSFERIACSYETVGGGLLKMSTWVPKGPPRCFLQASASKQEVKNTCSICKRRLRDKKSLEKHLRSHKE